MIPLPDVEMIPLPDASYGPARRESSASSTRLPPLPPREAAERQCRENNVDSPTTENIVDASMDEGEIVTNQEVMDVLDLLIDFGREDEVGQAAASSKTDAMNHSVYRAEVPADGLPADQMMIDRIPDGAGPTCRASSWRKPDRAWDRPMRTLRRRNSAM